MPAAPLYAATLRAETPEGRARLETWHEPLTIGNPLPTLPLWLASDLAVPLELEWTYEQTCDQLRLP